MVCPWFAHGNLRICGQGWLQSLSAWSAQGCPAACFGAGSWSGGTRGRMWSSTAIRATRPATCTAVLRKRPGVLLASIRAAMPSCYIWAFTFCLDVHSDEKTYPPSSKLKYSFLNDFFLRRRSPPPPPISMLTCMRQAAEIFFLAVVLPQPRSTLKSGARGEGPGMKSNFKNYT